MKFAAILAILALTTCTVDAKKSSKARTTGKSTKGGRSKRPPTKGQMSVSRAFDGANRSSSSSYSSEQSSSYKASYYTEHYSGNREVIVKSDFVTEQSNLYSSIPMDRIMLAMQFLQQYNKYRELVQTSYSSMTAHMSTLKEEYESMTIEFTNHEKTVSDIQNDVTRFKQIVNKARLEQEQLEFEYSAMYEKYQQTILNMEWEMKDKLHRFRQTWLGGLTDQEIYLKMKPISIAFSFPLNPWQETDGACVDNVNFFQPDSLHILNIGGDKFIGRTKCAEACMDDFNCVAFSAEHNDSETGECRLLSDGYGMYVGDGPRDPGWHCHVNLDREAMHSESYMEYPEDYEDYREETGNDNMDTNAAELLEMINYMDILV